MRTNPILRWGVSLAVIAGLLASFSAWGEASKGDCSKNEGICGCSYGRVLCCDGSYTPRHYDPQTGRLIENACMNPATATGLGQQIGTSLSNYRAPTKGNHFMAPSQEIFWRSTIFDR